MSDQSAEKTEPASEKRRQEFREKGEVARSRDVISVMILFSGVAYFMMFGRQIYIRMSKFLTRFFSLRLELEIEPEVMVNLFVEVLQLMAFILAPLVGIVVVVSILGNMAQVGVIFTVKPLTPDLNRLNFITKFFSTFFNKQALGNLVTSLLKMGVVGLVVYWTVASDGKRIQAAATLTLPGGIDFIIDRCLDILMNVSIVMLFIALADFAWNKYVMEERMKMTKQELKDEFKETEGNPEQKSHIRRRAMEISNHRMMADVPDADVIVNNPTHISVAIRYRQGEDAAPIVLAKGADLVALQIRKIANAHKIPMVENVPLARGLYKQVKVGRHVPSHFYRAVAEVLAYVYRLKAKRRGRRISQN